VRVSQVPNIDHGVRLEGSSGDQLGGLITSGQQWIISCCNKAVSYLRRVPGHSANSLPAHVVKGQALFLGLDIPDGHETGTATSHQNMSDLLVPVQTFNIVRAGRIGTQSEWVLDIVQV